MYGCVRGHDCTHLSETLRLFQWRRGFMTSCPQDECFEWDRIRKKIIVQQPQNVHTKKNVELETEICVWHLNIFYSNHEAMQKKKEKKKK
jgi:hypothetical protein